ncbi:SDR family NAD(P)-dependent oxidoreductase [uncultured Phycicoccus sp.]|uniref:SDR family NAD(P)-dependent oxidoreductase n=1 Tax=uncultured Phycicoccus sp. TaxID=661422 RepID=UPI0026182946|nr:SDR family NAD(P)-dependent oxidoreductase [uncultured Phycicoccus sp.]
MQDVTGELDDKVAFVTGAASGIGRACAVAMAAQGATVVLADIDRAGLDSAREELAARGATVGVVELDVRDEPAGRAAVEAVVAEHGRLDILANCAGMMLLAPALEADTAEWTAMIEINVLGLMYLTHAALPHLVASKGSVVQMSSMAARAVGRGASAYYASKFAVNGFSEGIRQEVTELGVRVIVIEPGTTETALRTHITHDESKKAIDSRVATYRQLQAGDVASAVMYALTAPHHVAVNEVLLRPTDQA